MYNILNKMIAEEESYIGQYTSLFCQMNLEAIIKDTEIYNLRMWLRRVVKK